MKYCLLSLIVLLLVHPDSYSQSNKNSTSVFTIKNADSLYFALRYKDAIQVYEKILKTDPANAIAWNRLGYCYQNVFNYNMALESYFKSLALKPTPPVCVAIQSRLARIYSIRNEKEKAFENLNNALQSGYVNIDELANEKDFNNIRSDKRFAKVVDETKIKAFPCMSIPEARQFDFWVGEWDVFPNGTNSIVGHSKIEVASGGCMILENWTATGPVPNAGKSMNFYNPLTKKWEQNWIGSGGLNNNNPQKFVNGEYRENAMRFDFEQFAPDGDKVIGRFSFFNEGPDQVRQFNETSTDGGKTWTTSYDLVYKRKK
jgi:tetratricopeptide (TPR) repeat protein